MVKKKNLIFDAAINLFSKKPYHMVAMDDIAHKAKVAKGTLYYHFKSKENLYISILQKGIDNVLMRLKAEVGNNSIENLRLFITGLVTFFNEQKDFFEVLRREEGKLLSKKLKDCYEKTCSIKDLLNSILSSGISEKCFRNDLDAQIVSEIILGMIKASVIGGLEAKKVSDTIFNMLLYGIKAERIN